MKQCYRHFDHRKGGQVLTSHIFSANIQTPIERPGETCCLRPPPGSTACNSVEWQLSVLFSGAALQTGIPFFLTQ